jgi:hypothetical protein
LASDGMVFGASRFQLEMHTSAPPCPAMYLPHGKLAMYTSIGEPFGLTPISP